MLNCNLIVERTLRIDAPSGQAMLSVGDEVFLKTEQRGWLYGAIVSLGHDSLIMVGPGIAGYKRIMHREIIDVRDTAPETEPYNLSGGNYCRRGGM